jgi:hypothetical protein
VEQIVLSCRMSHRGLASSHPRRYLDRARALTQRAHAHGATLTGWSAATVSFAWDTASTEEVIQFVVSVQQDAGAATDEVAWACGIAQGEMEALSPPPAPGESSRPPPPRGDLAWGPALVAAIGLCRIARPGEVLLDESLEALRLGALLRRGGRSGNDAGRPIRGARLDTRMPWKADAAARIASLVDPPLLARGDLVEAMLGCPGAVSVIRARPGLGGSRALAAIAEKTAPSPHLTVGPSGLGVEPLGALRRAFAQARGRIAIPRQLEAAHALLLAGAGVTLAQATSLVQGVLGAGSDRPAALLIDDGAEVDALSLEVCARALGSGGRPFVLVVRLDATDTLHPALAALPLALDVELPPLDAATGEALAESCTAGALTHEAAERWARRGDYSPLGIVEAIACSLATGEIAWIGETAFARRRLAGKGKPRPASAWILRRADELSAQERAVLSGVATLGADASRETLGKILAAVGAKVDTDVVVPNLIAARWLRATEPASARGLELPSRTHRIAVRELIGESRLRAWHRAAAQTLADAGPLTRAEAAHHALDAGDGPWAARLATEAARAAADLHLDPSAAALTALAQDAASREVVEVSRSEPPPPSSLRRPVDSDPPTIARPPPSGDILTLDLDLPSSIEDPSVAGSPIDQGLLAERMRAISELSQGQIAHAVHMLRGAHAKLKEGGASQSSLCQASLVLGVALAQAGQNDEALLQGLDALARAREGGDLTGEHACITFLAKLFGGTSHEKGALQLRARAATAPPG